MKAVNSLVYALVAAPAYASWVLPGPPRLARNNARPQIQQQRQGHLARQTADPADSWPYGPLRTRGRDVVNNRDEVVTWAGVNWPMSGETMIPEGLEWKSAEEIVDDIVSVGFNYIRMGYAIQMIDEIYDRGGSDVSLEEALTAALGAENGTRVTQEIVARNPSFTPQTTRFAVWSAVAKAAFDRGVFIHPDVHVGKAQWCCGHADGNAWFGDVLFDTESWKRGLAYVAAWAGDHPNVASMSLRNELRDSLNRTDLMYNWQTLVGNMSAGAAAIYEANPDLLRYTSGSNLGCFRTTVSWSGMQYDEDLSALTSGKNILTAPCYKCAAIRDAYRRDPVVFDLGDYAWGDKIIWELHLYSMSEDLDTGTCAIIEAQLYRNGFNALGIAPPTVDACDLTRDCPPAVRLTPVIFSEFGNAQDPTSLYGSVLQNCIRQYTIKHKISWMMWSLAGSYRVRQGRQSFVDTWGLTNADWTGWSHPDAVEEYWKPWVQAMNVTQKA